MNNQITQKPDNWLTLPEVQEYIREHRRHWSIPYIYILMNTGKLKYFKVGSTRVILKENIDELVKLFKRPAPRGYRVKL